MQKDCCSALIQDILTLMEQERQALLAEDEEKAHACLERRQSLLVELWDNRAIWDATDLQDKLSEVQAKQEELSKCAEELLGELRVSLNMRKKQTGYFSQSRHLDQQSQKSTYLTIRS